MEACICSLRSGLKEDENLSDLTILPPAIFKLIAGKYFLVFHRVLGVNSAAQMAEWLDSLPLELLDSG